MMRVLLGLLTLIVLALPAPAQEPVSTIASGSVILAFKVKISVPEGGKTRLIEMAPKVAVADGKEAEIAIEQDPKTNLRLLVLPKLGPKGFVDLELTVKAMLSGKSVTRRMRVVTLLGVPAVVEVDDERQGEKLRVEVTATRAP